MKFEKLKFLFDYERDNFEADRKKMPSDWIYHNKLIEYIMDEDGYRVGHTNEIDKSNYVLISGCSDTVGAGLAYEDTFAGKLTNDYGVVNTAVSGNSNEQIFNSIMEHLSDTSQYPKAIIINWSSPARMAFWEDGKQKMYNMSRAINHSSRPWSEVYSKYYFDKIDMWHLPQFNLYKKHINILGKILNIKVVHTTTFASIKQPDVKQFIDHKRFLSKKIDKNKVGEYLGRDLKHPGRLIHDQMYKYIIKQLKD